MASTSDNSKNNKRSSSPPASPQPSPKSIKRNPYEFYGVSQHVWDRCNDGRLGTEKLLLETHEKIVQKLKEKIKRDEESIQYYVKRVDENNKKVRDHEEQITRLVMTIFSPDP